MKNPVYKIRINKGDTVTVLAGKYKGQTGTVTATHPTENKVTVEGINIVKKATKPNKQYPQGGMDQGLGRHADQDRQRDRLGEPRGSTRARLRLRPHSVAPPTLAARARGPARPYAHGPG